MADTPETTREQVADAVEASLLTYLDSVDWLARDGFYRAIVSLGERDTVTLCASAFGPAKKLLLFMRSRIAAATEIAGAPDAEAIARLVGIFDEPDVDELWALVDEAFASCVVEWHVPELAELLHLGEAALPPNANMDAAYRQTLLARLPLPVIIRVLLGVVWLTKNF